ncbi:hypothetical protein SAMN05421837_112154 [Amycolatopsis pretoriensis]|uniref:Uncharacterized protein n=1 Tax=Amycolatopsis pretoriensis TaxID=218821 RepID=A0A1H5RF94_9PSEU|nr:hypothetical protein [Amycolatopsis pretoriensis]SEF37043.1 hypothetical protein SAMN05421837_112154 [Amycolatopsis pretoriensis]
MSREQFDAAIGAVPVSTVDVEAVLDRERRRARVRRVAIPWTAAGAGVAAVVVGAAFVFAPGERGTVLVPANPPPASPDPCAVSPFPPQTGPPIPEKTDVAANRLTGVLTAAVQQKVAYGTKLQPHAEGEYPKGKQHGPLTFFHVFSAQVAHDGYCSGGEDYFLAAATTAEGPRKGNIWAIVTRLGGHATPATECGDPPENMQQSCERKAGPHGEIVVEETLSSPGQATFNRTNVTKLDGTGVMVEAQNVADDAKKNHPDGPDMPSPPLSLAQLTDIALDPGLTLYP